MFGAVFHHCRLLGSSFASAVLSGCTIFGGDWSFVDLQYQDLSNQRLGPIQLVEADLRACNLEEADLQGANLSRANLSQARLRGANLRQTRVEGTDLRNVDLRGVKIDVPFAVAYAKALGAVLE